VSVGSVTPRKGFDVLIAALQPLSALPWTLTIAGDLMRDDNAPVQLASDIERFGFQQRVRTLGAVNDTALEALYQSADVFVLASFFEGYGMAYAEALARGLPVIGTTGGAIPDTVPQEAGLLVPPGDVQCLTQALRTVMQDKALRERLSQGAKRAAMQQPTWEQTVQHFAEVLERLQN
jgi:glycosyltransferase involved in cell wall biosynthesis